MPGAPISGLEQMFIPLYSTCMSAKNVQAEALAIELARISHDNKCEDVTVMDLRGLSSVTDFTVICTGTSDRQMKAVADRMGLYAETVKERLYGSSGLDNSTWILLDFVDVVVHIFAPAYRTYYDLELLWGDAPRIEWQKSEMP